VYGKSAVRSRGVAMMQSSSTSIHPPARATIDSMSLPSLELWGDQALGRPGRRDIDGNQICPPHTNDFSIGSKIARDQCPQGTIGAILLPTP
jgi:hypothetical protein